MTDTKFELLPELNERDRAIKYVRDLMDEFTVQKKNDDVKELREVYRLLQTKRYGIVWEEHAENVDEEMKSSVPVFIDEKARTINFNKDSDAYDFLIEGDNLHTLHLLQKTHLGKIDLYTSTHRIIPATSRLSTTTSLYQQMTHTYILSGFHL